MDQTYLSESNMEKLKKAKKLLYTSTPKKPARCLVLKEKQWNTIVAKVVRPKEEKKLKEEEKKMLEYLKQGSKKLISKWPEKKDEKGSESQDGNDKENEAMSNDEKRYREIQAASPEKRKELIANAENIVNAGKIKQGLIELSTAAVACEVLKGREIQREFNKERKQKEKKKTEVQNREHMTQAVRWIDDYNQKQIDGRKRFDQYKTDLKELCGERAKHRNDEKKERIFLERSHNDQHRKNQLNESAREKIMLEKKKEALRQNALEAMKMAEQRRARLKQADEIQEVIAKVHKEGKEKIKELITEQEKDMKIQNIISKEVLQIDAKKLDEEIKEKLKIEQEMIQKTSQEKLVIYDEKEKKKIEHLKKLKEQRIKDHLDDQERRKKEAEEKKEEDAYYFKQRVENDKVSTEYTKVKFFRKADAVKENRKFLEKQIKERENLDEEEKRESQIFDKREVLAKDQKFFKYAQELTENAKVKNRPTLPLIKTVQHYKKHNFLDIKVRELPHVISNVPIGRAYQIEESPNAKKSKARIRYDIDQLKMMNPYRGIKFLRKFHFA